MDTINPIIKIKTCMNHELTHKTTQFLFRCSCFFFASIHRSKIRTRCTRMRFAISGIGEFLVRLRLCRRSSLAEFVEPLHGITHILTHTHSEVVWEGLPYNLNSPCDPTLHIFDFKSSHKNTEILNHYIQQSL